MHQIEGSILVKRELEIEIERADSLNTKTHIDHEICNLNLGMFLKRIS